MAASSFRFLYRQAEGRIGRRAWAKASAPLVGLALAMTALALSVAPGPRDLATQPFFSVQIVAVHAYLLFYGFALIGLSVAEYFVSAKRFSDLGLAPELAGLLPFSLLIAGAAAWYQPRSEGTMPAWAVYPFYAVALGVIVCNVALLGFVNGPRER